MTKQLRKAVLASLGVAALAGVSTHASAQTSVAAGSLGVGGSYTTVGGNAVFSWDGHNNNATTPVSAMGWGHNVTFYTFTLTSAASLDINAVRTSVTAGKTANTNYNPAFTLWGTTGYSDPAGNLADGHGFDQTGTGTTFSANSYAVKNGLANAGDLIGGTEWLQDPNEGGVTGFIGYANSGTTGWHNSAGSLIGTGSGGTVTVANGSADLLIANLAAGNYLLAVGGSNACAGANNFSDATGACPTTPNPLGTENKYRLTLTAAAPAVAPVPVPAAVWLFGSALAGMGVIGRRKQAA